MIVEDIKEYINNALTILSYPNVTFTIDKSKFINQGDFNSNVALILKKTDFCKNLNPLEIAEKIVDHLPKDKFTKIEIVKPGFINFYLNPENTNELIHTINKENDNFPIFKKRDEIVSIEWVSANPTGYLHIGHARNAVLGEAVAKLFEKTGYKVIRDYVVNDAGNQMNILASSVLVRYLQLFNININLPDDSYHGEEIKLAALALKQKFNDKFINNKINEHFIIEDKNSNELIRNFARDFMLNQIKVDLAKIGVVLDCYYSELETHQSNKIPLILEKMKNYTYKKDGALWLKTSLFGDDKDRVLIKSDGVPTYFLPDIVYHDWKLQRDPKIIKLIHVWGSDHYSYLIRVRAALKCLGYDADKIFDVIFMQMVRLVKDNAEFKMSKRSGQSLTMSDLIGAIGVDNANWFLISASADSHLEIDVDIALKNDNNNPLYYVQYASARASQILIKNNYQFDDKISYVNLNLELEKNLINQMHFLKQTIIYALNNYEPQKITNYVYNLCKMFHSYYEQVKIVDNSNIELTKQRLGLVKSFKIVLSNALKLINISAKSEM